MADIIDFSSKRNSKQERLQWAIERCFVLGQSLIVGCNDRQKRYDELKAMFPDAELEIVGLGVKIWKKS